jgi:hypothetical protein
MNSTGQTQFKLSTRPLSIYVVTLWSLTRAIMPQLTAYGIYITAKYAARLESGFFANFLTMWVNFWAVYTKLLIIFSVIQTIVFLCLAVGILLGKNWGRVGFLWTSVAVLIWNMRAIIFSLRVPLALPLDSLIALCLAFWYFRRQDVFAYFQAEDRLPEWPRRKIGKLSLDLAIALGVGVFRIFSEAVGLILVSL